MEHSSTGFAVVVLTGMSLGFFSKAFGGYVASWPTF
jgi:hypothetical protein